MAGKILLNIFYTISIFLLLLSTIWSFNHNRFELLAAAIFLLVIMIVLKVRLIKQVKAITRKG